MSLKRVFHPTGDAFHDVPEGDVEQWAEAGWRKTKPKHVNDTDAPAVGAFYVATIPVEATATATPEAAPKVDKA